MNEHIKQRMSQCLRLIAVGWVVVLLGACASEHSAEPAGMVPVDTAWDGSAEVAVPSFSQRESDDTRQYLAYSHDFSVELPNAQVQPIYEQLLTACNTDEQFACVVVQSSIASGEFSRANLKLRVQSAGIKPLLQLLASQGQLVKQTTSAEDLSNAVVDNEKRIEMLLSYRTRLQALELQQSTDIDTLMKIASELATVQTDIEYAQGKKRNLLQRIKKDFLSIELYAKRQHIKQSFWQPITQAFDGLGHDIGLGISYLLTFLVYAVFWVPAIFIFLLVIRIFWRFIFKRGKAH